MGMTKGKRAKLAKRGDNPCAVLGEASNRIATGHVRTPRKFEATSRVITGGRKVSGAVMFSQGTHEWHHASEGRVGTRSPSTRNPAVISTGERTTLGKALDYYTKGK